jgi:hypothetical protein
VEELEEATALFEQKGATALVDRTLRLIAGWQSEG